MITLIRRRSSSRTYSNFCSKKQFKPLVDYKQRGQFRNPLLLNMGEKLHHFQVIQRKKYPDFEIDYAGMKCVKHGIQWHHFDCEQEINSMGLMIKCQKVPQMIKLCLEKMLQCGSKKFPVRNPIEHMSRRSFSPQNYGFVTEDYLFYGFKTSLLQDHINLQEVFLQMMFNPLFRKEDFEQLVWRYSYRQGINLQVVGDLANQLDSMWFLNETKVFDSISRNLVSGIGMNTKKQLMKLTYQDALRWYKQIFVPQNMVLLTHGDLHPTKIGQNFRKISSRFQWGQSTISLDQKQNVQKPNKTRIQQLEDTKSKTIKIDQLETSVPMILSFKLDDLTTQERVLLPILTYILFDMPGAVLMNWNTPQTPYPKHYGYQTTHFNIGITLVAKDGKNISDSEFLDQQKLIRQELQKLVKQKIPDVLIQQCLLHLEGQYYTSDGMKIINGCLDKLVDPTIHSDSFTAIDQALNVKKTITKLMRSYRKQNIFQKLLQKHIVDNEYFLRIWGKNNPHLVDDAQFYEKVELRKLYEKMDADKIEQIKKYQPPSLLQDYRVLPKLQINQLQIFQEKSPHQMTINGVKISHTHKCDGIKIVFRFDISDIEEDQIRLLPILAQALPWMGPRGIDPEAYKEYLALFIRDISVRYETVRSENGMKIYLFVQAQFTDRNSEHGFNLCTNLLHDFNIRNITAISERIQRKASQTYNQLSENLVEIHGRHLASSRSPYALIEDPLFMCRSTCSLAADLRKISNPKRQLQSIAHQLFQIISKMNDKNRLAMLVQCRRESFPKYQKYLQLILNPLRPSTTILETIDQKGFIPSPCLKYFPNYAQEYIFQAFSMPYYNNIQEIPASLVLSSMINQNIRTYNPLGGCFLFKGALIAYMRGSRKKFIELESYYKKIEQIDQAKRFIFQKFRRYTATDQFYSGLSAQETRHFKQAVALVDEDSVQAVLEKYIMNTIKEGSSSILALGPHLGNYQPLIKKGWEVQRAVEDMSRKMESSSPVQEQIEMSKYINLY